MDYDSLQRKFARMAVAKDYLERDRRARPHRKNPDLRDLNEPASALPDVIFTNADMYFDKIWRDIDFAASLGGRIKAIRKNYSLTQAEFADLLNVKQASVSRWEKDKAEPDENTFLDLAALSQLKASDIRYGLREITSSGEMAPMKPVEITGELTEDGTLEIFGKNQGPSFFDLTYAARPIEGRPHDDVVAFVISANSGFSVIRGAWIGFYRSGLKVPPGMYHGQTCIIKPLNKSELYLGYIMGKTEDIWTVLTGKGDFISFKIEWVTPVLSLRQFLPNPI